MDEVFDRGEDSVGMTDYQFRYVLDLQDKYAALRKEFDALSGNKAICLGKGMTDLQFAAYKEDRDRREAELLREIIALREENTKLKMRTPD